MADEEKNSRAAVGLERPRKRNFRQRAHCNPLSDSYIKFPSTFQNIDWSLHFPVAYGKPNFTGTELALNTFEEPIDYDQEISDFFSISKVTILDVGCGYGGMMVNLSPLFPNDYILGLEIREKLVQYVGRRIASLRHISDSENGYGNVSVLRTNGMKFLLNYIPKESLKKMFFCFPDPHIKKSKWRRRIINRGLLTQYAYVLKEGGIIYTITDVPELHHWMVEKLGSHPYFERLSEIEMKEDPCVELMAVSTEEGNKARRENRNFQSSVFRKLSFEKCKMTKTLED
eukprot:GHVP01009783.1.p1 GENE.GHVP01009783.1~~GHVP01009783.1.p1  ORF type:complete len:286 (+),score=53.15 GHVP01009783.1:593-1450(+)